MYTSEKGPIMPAQLYSPHRQLANPAPLGLFGFAIVSILSAVLKFSSDTSARMDGLYAGTAIFLGGIAQFIAALFQFVLNNTHSASTFGLFGLHWMSQGVQIFVLSMMDMRFQSNGRPAAQVTYYALLTVATVILWIPTFRMNAILNVTLACVIVVFGMDVVAAYDIRFAEIISGTFAIIASSLALYMATLDLVNEAWKRQILPLFPHKDHKLEYRTQDGYPYVPKRVFHKSSVSSVHL